MLVAAAQRLMASACSRSRAAPLGAGTRPSPPSRGVERPANVGAEYLMSPQQCQFALAGLLCIVAATPISAAQPSMAQRGQASWYGDFHEGKLMANQRP